MRQDGLRRTMSELDKPARLQKIEDYWDQRGSAYVSFRASDHWYVILDGAFDYSELVEIYRALKATNRAGVL